MDLTIFAFKKNMLANSFRKFEDFMLNTPGATFFLLKDSLQLPLNIGKNMFAVVDINKTDFIEKIIFVSYIVYRFSINWIIEGIIRRNNFLI